MMADTISHELTGMDEVLGKLSELSHDVKYKGGRFALRKAAKLIELKLKEGAESVDDPGSHEKIADNVAIRWSGRTFKRSGDLKFRVGIMGGAGGRAKTGALSGLPGGDTRHWRLLEFGTEKMRAQPFMRTALSQNVEAAIGEFAKHYPKAIDRALARAKKKAA